jgi:hypothetical protein
MKTTYERQLLIELETKKDAIQSRLDYLLSEKATPIEMQALENEWNRLMEKINDIKSELNGV